MQKHLRGLIPPTSLLRRTLTKKKIMKVTSHQSDIDIVSLQDILENIFKILTGAPWNQSLGSVYRCSAVPIQVTITPATPTNYDIYSPPA
jgi:hypothetical protein